MLKLILTAALASSNPTITVPAQPAAVDTIKEQPVVCARQFLLNAQRQKIGLEPNFDYIIEYAIATKMTNVEAVNYIRGCAMFTYGVEFGVLSAAPKSDPGDSDRLSDRTGVEDPFGGYSTKTSG